MERTAREIMDNCQDLVNNIREYPKYLTKHKGTIEKIESLIYGISDDILEDVANDMEKDEE
jgi:carbonic anhydrase